MADDIDIEEHDVLDNPRIKNIFPDITTIKTEVEDYVEEEIAYSDDDDYQEPYRRSINIEFEESNNFRSFQNKIIVGNKPSTAQSSEIVFQNKIILGSNIPITHNPHESEPKDLTLPETSVVLNNWNNYLMKTPCYCHACHILFPTENALDSHKMTAHSFLVAVGRNKAIKSTAKSSIASKIKVEPSISNAKDLICNHCNEVFPNEIALIKHSYELIPRSFECDKCNMVFENGAAYKAHKATHSNVDLFVFCQICTCHFKLLSKLGTHMRVNHQTSEVDDAKYVTTNFECLICKAKLKDSKYYNVHIQSCHPELYNKKSNPDGIPKFKCPQCNLSFCSDYSVRIHRAKKHGFVDMEKISNLPETFLKGTTPPRKKQFQTVMLNKCRPLPKSTIYKCYKCQIHFVSCFVAFFHSKRCVLKKGDWKCQKCRRSFRLKDRVSHNYQHEITEKFKVIEVSDSIISRIICRCRKCKVCFDERTILYCHAESCSTNSYVTYVKCTVCQILLHAKSAETHKKLHADGLTPKDFIIIDYVHSGINEQPSELSNSTETAQFTDSIESSENITSKEITKRLNRKYYYCPTCKCFLKRNRDIDKHNQAKCNTEISKYTCKHCGLRFAPKTFQNHKTQHKLNPKLKLRDFDFFNIQTGKPIDPPYPDFQKCKTCNVRFFSVMALNNHICNSEVPKTCMYCGEDFSDLAYKLHVPYHQFTQETNSSINENIPELLKKYQSLEQVWNILFLCKTCDIVLDSYDKVVEHCQDHFCNTPNVTTEHCKICNLKFIDNCYTKHNALHGSNDINRGSFKILEYKYNTLLSDSWLDIFNTLTKEQVDLILSKSMYRFTRCVRMTKIADGPLSLTLYQCGVCKMMVPENKIAEHSYSQSSTCLSSPKKFICSICNFPFATKNHKIDHENLHEGRRLDAKSFRILRFIADKQFQKNNWSPKEHSEALKFIRCLECGKLINKQKYKTHTKYHLYYNRTKAKRVVVKHKKIIHHFYKCRDCNRCVAKQNIKEHHCTFDDPKKKCTKCSLWFKSSSIASHNRYHDRYEFNIKNITVTYFENGVIDEKPIPKLLLSAEATKEQLKSKPAVGSEMLTGRSDGNKFIFYQCTNCSTCIINKCNIKNHTCRPAAYRLKCDLCGLSIYASHFRSHRALHDIKKFSNKNLVIHKFNNTKSGVKLNSGLRIYKKEIKTYSSIARKRKCPPVTTGTPSKKLKAMAKNDEKTLPSTPETMKAVNKNDVNHELSNKDFMRYISCRYFKCKGCKLLFVTCSSLLAHEESCLDDRDGVKCDDCGLILHSTMIEKHKTLQKCKIRATINIWLVTVKSKGKFPDLVDTWLYSCQKCDVYSLSVDRFYYHFSLNHVSIYKMITCKQCHVKFSTRIYSKHITIHHEKYKMAFSDLSIAEVEDTTLDEVLKDLPNKKDVRIQLYNSNVNKKEDKEIQESINLNETVTRITLKEDRAVAKPISGIYNCDTCGLNFVNIISLKTHKHYGRHDEIQYSCPECGLSFTQPSLRKHMVMHHSKKHKKQTNHWNQNKSETSSNIVANESVVEAISKMFMENDADHKRAASTSSSNDNAEGNLKVLASTIVNQNECTQSVSSNENKLFKCSLCDVYFLTADVCLDHISEHTALDPTEYIACKICDLQFPCEYLGKHMKRHRDNAFCIDDLIVAEYHRGDGGEIRIDTYSAADRLKSKLVSTTTHSDYEDEKDNTDVHCVDSTTENLLENNALVNDVSIESNLNLEGDIKYI